MGDGLRTWVGREIKRLGWSYRELARQAGISHTLISRTLSGDMPASADFCIKIAQALGESPEKVLRLAGILLPLPDSEDDPTLSEAIDTLRNLPPNQRKEALRYIRYLYQTGQDD
jgi:transcriptional regulator with XRE-family HTH domain